MFPTSGHKVSEVAKGNAELYVDMNLVNKWDTCAGHAIMESTGGRMTTTQGHEIDYSNATSEIFGILAARKRHDFYWSSLKPGLQQFLENYAAGTA